jgi:putative inorganic carbon (hco3(-)) transporter
MPPAETSTIRPKSYWGGLSGRLLSGLGVIVTGVLLGQQYVYPNKRVLPVIIGLVVSGLAWRVGMVAGLGVLLMALPFPRGTIFGNTNLALILILLIIWLLRIGQRQSPPPRRSPFDLPIVGLLIMYVLSFLNVGDQTTLVRALQNFELFLGAVLMFYLIINNVRTNTDLERLHQFMLISATAIFGVALYELNHPASTFIEGWIDFSSTVGTEFNTRNVRVGSMFHDYELLSEYCALTLLTVGFLLLRARSLGRRTLYGVLLALNSFVLFTTVTRGAIIALAVGLAYFLFLTRRRLRFIPFTIVTTMAVLGAFAMDFYVSHFTRSGDMFKRLVSTRVVGGWMPEDRAETWANAWGRAMVHPLLGSGPAYRELPGWQFWWPHNVYLYYANIVGFPGLFFFVWLLGKAFVISRPATDDLRDPDYAKAYVLICRVQLVVFAINEFKIDYLRNNIYLFPVWVMFAVWAATSLIARSNALAAAATAAEPESAPLPALRAASA